MLGVRPGADIIELAAAFQREIARFQDLGGDLAERRRQRLRAAYDELMGAQGLRSAPDPVLAGWVLEDDEPFDFSTITKDMSAAEKMAERVRINILNQRVDSLVAAWNEHVHFLVYRQRFIDEAKEERGLRFTWLKATLGRSDEARTIWAAECYLRRGAEEQTSAYDGRRLGVMVRSLAEHRERGTLPHVHEGYLEEAENAVRERINNCAQALEILRGQRRYIDFRVS